MPQIEVNEEQVLRALDQLSPTARRLALAKLIPGYDALDRLVEHNRGRIEAVCRERGLDFARMTDQVRRADLIVSGDRHLLALGSLASVPVLTAREFLDRLGGANGQADGGRGG
jgi:hypothetical protein